MVSPSKHRKIDRKAGKANISVAAEPSGNKKPKSAKIFENKKFYLDIKNRSALTKLEKQLKELGATVEQFLVREVNVFITDRSNVNTNSTNTPSPLQSPAASISPSLSHSPSPSPVNINSPTDGVGARRTRSRAEAMLESVRQQPGRILYSADPFENAKAWRIPIYSLQKFLRFLEKKLVDSSPSSSSRKVSGVKVLKGNYIKLEEGDLRPEFRELKSWPRINYKTTSGCPFDSPTKRKLRAATGGVPVGAGAVAGNEANNTSRRERMTRKQQSSTDSDQRHGGYCEMCCEDYSDLSEHLVSPGHLKLANDPTQFAVLDNLIKETFHNNTNGDMCPTLLAAATTNNRRVLRSNKSPADVGLDCHDIMGNKHTNSDKQSDHRQSSPALLLPSVVLQQSNNLTANSTNMTNGHVTRSTTAAIHRQQSINSNSNYSSVDQPPSDPSSNKKLPPQPPPLQEVQCNGVLVNHCHLTRLSVKTESLHIQQQQLQEQQRQNLSPTDSDHNNSHHLRSKKQLWLPTSLLGTTAEDEGNPVRVKNEPKAVSPKGKRRKLRRKRLSVEEKLIEDNKSYYKVEVLNSKLRSTGYYMTQRELELNRLKANESSVTDNSNNGTEQTQTKPAEKEPVVVRFKKVRKSELSLLSDEAESFMFGEPVRKDTEDESSTETEDNSNENQDNSSSNHSSCSISNSSNKKEIKKEEIVDESSMGSCSSSSQSTMKRKRRTHAEMFIHDNLDYYKFDIQGSRLRLHGGLLQPVTNLKVDPLDDESADSERKCKVEDNVDDKSKIEIPDIKQEDENAEDSEEMTADQLSFSFETVPELEPWYQTFRRQDECSEIYHPVYSDYPKIRLPYEYPSFIKQKLLLNAKKLFPFRLRKKRRRFLKSLEDKPRKSPRCHASTLAILSSLKYRRKKDSPDKLKVVEPIQPQATPLPPPSQPVVPNSIQLHEEESRSSTIEVSSLPDTSLKVPEEKVPQELNMRDVAESIDVWFQQLYNDDADSDKYINLIKVLSRALVTDDENHSSTPTTSHSSKGKQKSSKSSPKNNTNGGDANTCGDINNWDVCLDVDPSIISEMEDVTTTLVSGPEIDMSILIDNYRNCNSMERADYEHLHPRAIDALRFCATDGSCNSSDCGGSSTCELLGFTEDGRMLSKRRKRKKRNMTGWPKDKPKKLTAKTNKDDVLLSKCDATSSSTNDVNKFDSDGIAHTDDLKSNSACDNDVSSLKSLVENDNIVEPSASAKNNKLPKVKITRSLSRTGSCDSSGPLSDCTMCFIHVGPRHLRGHSNSVDLPSVNIKSSPMKRRASSPEKRSPGRGRRRRTCVTKWSPWASRRGR